jgi:hypothetical protein
MKAVVRVCADRWLDDHKGRVIRPRSGPPFRRYRAPELAAETSNCLVVLCEVDRDSIITNSTY